MHPSTHADLDQPSPWVVRFASCIPPGDVLDVACGTGRHARHLHRLGYNVLAIDRDATALAEASRSGVATLRIDLENGPEGDAVWPFGASRFMGIVVTNYLHRPLLHRLTSSLAPGGVLIYETFAQGNESFGKPSNPHFLLEPGELIDAAQAAEPNALQIVAYECGQVKYPRPALIQRLCARRPERGGQPVTLFLD